MFCAHPHGLLPYGFATMLAFEEYAVPFFTAVASAALMIPIVRDMLGATMAAKVYTNTEKGIKT